jgi:hypothetical protein
VADERDSPTVKAKILAVVAGLLFPNALNELVGMTTAVTQSDLDWTIARITRPTGGKPKGTVRAGFLGRDKVGSVMSRADIAAFSSPNSPTKRSGGLRRRSATNRQEAREEPLLRDQAKKLDPPSTLTLAPVV